MEKGSVIPPSYYYFLSCMTIYGSMYCMYNGHKCTQILKNKKEIEDPFSQKFTLLASCFNKNNSLYISVISLIISIKKFDI